MELLCVEKCKNFDENINTCYNMRRLRRDFYGKINSSL